MADKKNLCAMIPADLHARIMADKEQLGMNTLGDYMEMVLNKYFGGTIMAATKTFAIQLSVELVERLQAYLKSESERTGRKITQKEFISMLIEQALDEAGA